MEPATPCGAAAPAAWQRAVDAALCRRQPGGGGAAAVGLCRVRRRSAGLGIRGAGDLAGGRAADHRPLYRDRGDAENNFDELKNQGGWGGFTTQDLTRCRLMARIVALVCNWWNLLVRLADPDQPREAITSRPLLLQ